MVSKPLGFVQSFQLLVTYFFEMRPIDKFVDVAKATAKLNVNPQEGYNILAIYACLANPLL